MLVLMYYLSQNPHFAESVKPLMGQLKNSEQMLSFLNDLSRFTQTFSTFQSNENSSGGEKPKENERKKDEKKEEENNKKTPQSPTSGIADEFIQQILESYLTKH